MLRRGAQVVKLLSKRQTCQGTPISAILKRKRSSSAEKSAPVTLSVGAPAPTGSLLPGFALVVLALVFVLVLGGCQKQGPLPGQSEVPPPGYGDGEGGCETLVKDGSTLIANRESGWGIILPDQGWELDCADATRVSAKLSSELGESLLLSVARAESMPADERKHLEAIHARARHILPEAGARLANPRYVVARASASSDEKTVLVYQVLADAFVREGMVSYHGWSVVHTAAGDVFECHLNVTSKKRLDWPGVLGRILASCTSGR